VRIPRFRQAGASPNETFHVGDQPEDTKALRAANVVAIGSAWGIADKTALKASKPDRIFDTVDELKAFLLK
jgi:phosphoglycolate phosphatase-like HAD superfamily hydrolase